MGNNIDKMMPAGSMKGQVALVTGGASGIGLAIAEHFAAAGATVLIGDLTEAVAPAHAGMIALDVSDEGAWRYAVEQVLRQHGRLDVLVNNAGIGARSALVDLPLADWRRVMAVNLDGAFLGIKHVAAAMRRGGGGSIVNIASMLASVAVRDSAAYCASKGGLIALTRAAALELAPDGIRVNAVSPGWIETPLLRARLSAQPEREAALVDDTPLGRLGQCDEVAAAVLYLVSPAATFVTGTTLTLDGGYTAR